MKMKSPVKTCDMAYHRGLFADEQIRGGPALLFRQILVNFTVDSSSLSGA